MDDHQSSAKNKDLHWHEILITLSATFVSLSIGISINWLSPSIPILLDEDEDFNVSIHEVSYLAIVAPVAIILTAPIYLWLSYFVGPKSIIMFVGFLQCAIWILTAVANSLWLFYFIRFLCGTSYVFWSAVVVYVGEITTPKIRAEWGNSMTIFTCLGQLLGSIVGGRFSIPNAAFLYLFTIVIFFVTFTFAPESPYYFLMNEKIEDARKSLQVLRARQNVDDELKQMHNFVKTQMLESSTSWKDFFASKSNRSSSYVCIFLKCAGNLSGFLAFQIYGQYFFGLAGDHLSPNDSATIIFAVAALASAFGGYFLEVCGRRRTVVFSSFMCSVIFSVETVYFYLFEETDVDLSHMSWLPLAGTIAFVIFYHFGLGIAANIMSGELFSQNFKNKGMLLVGMFNGLSTIVTLEIFHKMHMHHGLYTPFLFFTAICFLSAIVSYYLIPETKCKTLEEIQKELKKQTIHN